MSEDHEAIRNWVGPRAQSIELLGTWTHPHWGPTGAQGEAHYIGSRTLIGLKQPDNSRMAISIDTRRGHAAFDEIVRKFDALVAKHFPQRKQLVRRGAAVEVPEGSTVTVQLHPSTDEQAEQFKQRNIGTDVPHLHVTVTKQKRGKPTTDTSFSLFAEAGRISRETKAAEPVPEPPRKLVKRSKPT